MVKRNRDLQKKLFDVTLEYMLQIFDFSLWDLVRYQNEEIKKLNKKIENLEAGKK